MNIRRFSTVATLAAALALTTSACSFDVSLGDNKKTPTASPSASSSATSTASDSAPGESANSTASETNPAGVTGSGHVAAGTSEAKPVNIPVPANTGLKKLELLHIYGGRTSGGFGQSVAIFEATTDRPMMITTKVTIMDKAGKKLRDQEGINTFYRSGKHTFIAHNLVELEDWDAPATFRVEVVDTTDSDTNFSELSQPSVTTGDLSQELTGSFRYSGEYPSGLSISGACVLDDGEIVFGENAPDQGVTDGTYRIPMYDAPKGSDLSNARCFVSV